ncbi:MAG: hypothetical protein IPM54_11045 [Polyangiaceae bacterium]|nr:hypothetical protein [Polyangiaceae bacterium]
MASSPNECLANTYLTLCDDVFFLIASTARLDDDLMRDFSKRRSSVLQAIARGASPEQMGQWESWLLRMSAAIAPIAPPRWLAMSDVIDEGVSLEHGARGVRSLFTSKPSEKDVARVQSFGGFAARALASVLAATGEFHPEARAQRGCFVASLGLPEAEQKALASEEPMPVGALEVPEGLPPKLARAVLRGAFVAAMLEGTDPREEQAVLVIGKKTGLPAEEITAAHGEARQRMEAAKAFRVACCGRHSLRARRRPSDERYVGCGGGEVDVADESADGGADGGERGGQGGAREEARGGSQGAGGGVGSFVDRCAQDRSVVRTSCGAFDAARSRRGRLGGCGCRQVRAGGRGAVCRGRVTECQTVIAAADAVRDC